MEREEAFGVLFRKHGKGSCAWPTAFSATGSPQRARCMRRTCRCTGTGTACATEYILDDDGDGTVAPDRRGTVTVRPDGAIELRPSEGTPCDTTYSRLMTTGATLAAELADSSGGRIGAARDTWIRLN
jgi:hypothetical protein